MFMLSLCKPFVYIELLTSDGLKSSSDLVHSCSIPALQGSFLCEGLKVTLAQSVSVQTPGLSSIHSISQLSEKSISQLI